jgi:hypothetical protein
MTAPQTSGAKAVSFKRDAPSADAMHIGSTTSYPIPTQCCSSRRSLLELMRRPPRKKDDDDHTRPAVIVGASNPFACCQTEV